MSGTIYGGEQVLQVNYLPQKPAREMRDLKSKDIWLGQIMVGGVGRRALTREGRWT